MALHIAREVWIITIVSFVLTTWTKLGTILSCNGTLLHRHDLTYEQIVNLDSASQRDLLVAGPICEPIWCSVVAPDIIYLLYLREISSHSFCFDWLTFLLNGKVPSANGSAVRQDWVRGEENTLVRRRRREDVWRWLGHVVNLCRNQTNWLWGPRQIWHEGFCSVMYCI